MVDGPVAPVPAPPIPRRQALEWAGRGAGVLRPNTTYVQNDPNLGTSIPVSPIFLAMDVATTSFSVSSLAGGASTTINQNVPFPAIPPMKTKPTDQIVAHVTLNVNHATNGLVIASSYAVVYVTTADGQISGPVFPGSTNFGSWGAAITVLVTNVTGGALSGTFYATAQAQVMFYPIDTIALVNVQTASPGQPSPIGGSTPPPGGGSGGAGRPPGGGPPGGGRGPQPK